jgi:two-component system, chemotaxis family, protein-glutamate methylesterase/glutaminase
MGKHDSYIVGVGASAGGQIALKEFFRSIPSDINAAFVVVTHLFRDFRTELPSILSRFTDLKVSRLADKTSPKPGHVYVMPEDVIATMQNGFIVLKPRPADNLINNTINTFFESLAIDKRSKAIGVILSGMGSDGANGAVKIFENGGDILVQDPGSTKFNSMPMATIMKDHPDFILPPQELGLKLTKMLRQKNYEPQSRQASREEQDRFAKNG